MTDPGAFDRIYATVRRIQPGRVATYGQVGLIALGKPHAARTVGWALHGLPDGSDVPWHRVVNAAGRIVTTGREGAAAEQRLRLEEEGIIFNPDGRIDFERFGWEGR
jgi:methylated-DNA-protein-cysteine methyltransferase-like protein